MDAATRKKCNVKGNSNAMVNSLWFGGIAQNAMNFKSLKKNEKLIPEEIMRKFDDVFLKLAEVKCLLGGKDVPSKNGGNNSPVKSLDNEEDVRDCLLYTSDAADE